MKKQNLYDALESCLNAIEAGADLESCLAEFPQYADDLRPLLETAVLAGSLCDQKIPANLINRNRTYVLQYAVQMERPSRWSFSPAFRMAVVSFAMLLFLVIGGTGLVSASSSSLPGDRLYGIKRTYEVVRLQWFSLPAQRPALEDRYRQERVTEAEKLIQSGRTERVEFEGTVTFQSEDRWIVSGITVLVNQQTRLDGLIVTGSWVEVEGLTGVDGLVLAERIRAREPEDDSPSSSGSSGPSATKPASTPVPATKSPEPRETERRETESPEPTQSATKTPEPREFELEGIVERMDGRFWTINERVVFIDPDAEVKGNITVGARVRVKGFIRSDGQLVGKKVELKSSSSGEGSGGSGSGSGGSPTPGPSPTHDD